MSESGELPEAQKGPVTAVAFSPNGELLAAGDVGAHRISFKRIVTTDMRSNQSGGKIVVYDMKERKVRVGACRL